jgi:asparagine synthase (glutamine-hydrolysing)
MCGIAGKLYLRSTENIDAASIRRMTAVLRHRGPDDEGLWVSGPIGLGSRRLAIIDLSALARQPMTNEDGTLRIVFNGEIYNFQELRSTLESKGHLFKSASDTETILHLYEDEGAECVQHLRGMFAFALWDNNRRTLLLARDRLGKKPLYYYYDGTILVFASQPNAILQEGRVPAEPNFEAIHHFLTFGYVPSPLSAFRGIRKLPPAHYLLVQDGRLTMHRYWSLRYTPKRVESEPALAEELLALLEEAVRLRLIADVPLGVLLSGGIDSSAVVALMRRITSGPVRSFSVGFTQPNYDELRYARQVAECFNTEHHEFIVKPDAISVLPRLVWHYNEPFADSSALPSFLLCEMAGRFVTVTLSGDGGDECFFGYDRYQATVLGDWFDMMPGPVRWAMAQATRFLPQSLPKSRMYRLRRFAEVLNMERRRRYGSWTSFFDAAAKRNLYTREFASFMANIDSHALLEAAFDVSDAPSFLEAAVSTDVRLNLPDDLLVKMDIASMAHSLEVRSPFLDHRVVEFAARLPSSLKLRRLAQKYLLKRALKGVVPDSILRRPKMGFSVPLGHWFRDELKEMAFDLLLDGRALQRGYFRPEAVRKYLQEHISGSAHHHSQLWNLLVLECWHRTFIDGARRTEPLDHF